MNKIEIRQARGEKELPAVLRVRKKVFTKGQKVPRELDLDGLDKGAEHIVVLDGRKPIGCARIRYSGDAARLERIAILEEFRGKGIGKQLTEFLISHCRAHGAKEIIIHAQSYLEEFYRSFGFERAGAPFFEVGIEHVEMRKKLV